MELKELKIVFMGTPGFAVASLLKLLEAGCNIVGVITAPDKAAGRGMQVQQSAVKKYAVEKGLHILQPEKLKDPVFLKQLEAVHADLQVVVAFRMLPELVWKMPPMGTINLHGSLLPQYRGAAPINWAIINGEKETGVTTFKLQQEIDTGNILLSSTIPIGEDETAGELHDKMKEAGAELLLKTIKGIAEGTLYEIPQSEIALSLLGKAGMGLHAPKIFTETCRINWEKSVDEVYNLIRGLSPYPAAFTELEGKKMKIYKAGKETSNGQTETVRPGEYQTDNKTFLKFVCADGYISVIEMQIEGKKKMHVEDFLRGFHFK
jgi:methionyl-tRNA formyltransferase